MAALRWQISFTALGWSWSVQAWPRWRPTLGPIPLGLGAFGAACVGMLNLLGVAIEAALAAMLLLRGLTFWLPMLPGFVACQA